MAIAAIISALVLSAIVALRYLAASGLFAFATARRRPALLAGRRSQIRREIGWSLLSAPIYGLPAGIIAWGWQERGWTLIYTDWQARPLWYLPISFLLYLLAHDSWFYWTHRWMHRPAPYRIMHAVHHGSRQPTAFAAMCFHPFEALTGALVIPLLVFVIPAHASVLLAVLLVMTIMGTTNHLGWEIFPRRLVSSPVGDWLITASHHQRHHQHHGSNFGLYFRLWDRLCGTDRGLAQGIA